MTTTIDMEPYTKQQRRIIAALAKVSPDVIAVDDLADLVWEGRPKPQWTESSLRVTIHRMRSTFAYQNQKTFVIVGFAGNIRARPNGRRGGYMLKWLGGGDASTSSTG